LTNNACGECATANDTFYLHQLYDEFGEPKCEWECDFIEWECTPDTITVTVVEEEGNYKIRATLDDIVWEKDFGTEKPDCLVSHVLDYVSGGTACTAVGSTATYVPSGLFGEHCQCGDCTDCVEGRTPWGLIFDVSGLDEGIDGCNDNCYCYNGRWGLNATSEDRCTWRADFGCKPSCGDRPWATMVKTPGEQEWTLTFYIASAIFRKVWNTEPDCASWSRMELDWLNPLADLGAGSNLVCTGEDAKVYVTSAPTTPGNKYGWVGSSNDPYLAGCGVCECDETIEPQEAQPMQLLLTWDHACGDVASSYMLTRYQDFACACDWRIYFGSCLDNDGVELNVASRLLKRIRFKMDVDLVTPVLNICRYVLDTHHSVVGFCPRVSESIVSAGASRCVCDPIDVDFGTFTIEDEFGVACVFTNVRVREM
jgi:hypothetical protein